MKNILQKKFCYQFIGLNKVKNIDDLRGMIQSVDIVTVPEAGLVGINIQEKNLVKMRTNGADKNVWQVSQKK